MTGTIQAEIKGIKSKSSTVEELLEKKEKKDKRRAKIKQTVTQFDELQSELTDLHTVYRELCQLKALAEEMGVEDEDNLVTQLTEDITVELTKLQGKQFEDFNGESEVRTIRDKVGELGDDVDDIQDSIQSAVDARCMELEDELETKQTVLRIPDIGDRDDESKVADLKRFVEACQDGKISEGIADRYRTLMNDYQEVEISFDTLQEDYDLEDESVEELKRLLNEGGRTLADVDVQVLADLKSLPDFSERLTIQFNEGR